MNSCLGPGRHRGVRRSPGRHRIGRQASRFLRHSASLEPQAYCEIPGTKSICASARLKTGVRCCSSRPGRPTTSRRSCAGAGAGCARARKSVTRTSGRATCRRNYGIRPVFSTWRFRDLCPASSRAPTFVAICTCTPRTATGATRTARHGRRMQRARIRVHRDHRSLRARRDVPHARSRTAFGGSATRSRSSGAVSRTDDPSWDRGRYPHDGRIDCADDLLDRSTSSWRRCTNGTATMGGG